MEALDLRASAYNHMRKLTVIGGTNYISVPLEYAKKYNLRKGMLYECLYDNGALIFRPVELVGD